MAKFLKFKPRNHNELKEDGHFRTGAVTECVECNKIFAAKNFYVLAADLDLHGWKYYKGKEYDIEGPMCPKCQELY